MVGSCSSGPVGDLEQVVDAEGGEEGPLTLGADRVDVVGSLALGIDENASWARAAGLAQDLDQDVADRSDVGGVALVGDVDRLEPLWNLGHHRRNVAVLGGDRKFCRAGGVREVLSAMGERPGTTMTVSMPNGATSKPIDSAKASPADLLAM